MLALDVLLLLMISVCVVYCWILNQRIRDLHNSRAEFASMIKVFDTAVVKAEHCISDLSVLGKNSTAQVKKAADTAHEVIEELKTVYAIGDKVGTKLELSIMEARKYQKSIEEAPKTKKQHFKAEEEYIDEVEDQGLVYDDFPKTGFAVANEYAKEENSIPQNLLDKVLHKLTTHRNTGAADQIDQAAYYGTLKKISIRK